MNNEYERRIKNCKGCSTISRRSFCKLTYLIDFLKDLYLERDVNSYAYYSGVCERSRMFRVVLLVRVPVSSGAIWLSFLPESGDKLRRKRIHAHEQEFPRIFLRVKRPRGERGGCITSRLCSSMRERGLFISWL